MSDYSIPSAGGDKFPLADLDGSLLRIEVIKQHMNVTTTFGPSNPVEANVVVLDGASKGSEYAATFIFPKVLCSQLAPSAGGKPVLGRLGRGTAKPGQSAPWMLTAPTEGDIAVAVKFDAYKATQVATVAAADSPW
jgi:hypothetical protein